MYSKLFERGQIGPLTLKNRAVMTSMTTGYAGLDGAPTEQLCQYYEERAKGGVGLIVTEIFKVNTVHGVAFPRQLYALNPRKTGRKTGTVLLFLSPCSYMKQRDRNKRTVPCFQSFA